MGFFSSTKKKRKSKSKSKSKRRSSSRPRSRGGDRAANTECPICLEDFAAGAELKKCNVCDCLVHGHCIRRWCGRKPSCTCPNCRAVNTFPLATATTAAAVNAAQVNDLIDYNNSTITRRRRRTRPTILPQPRNRYLDDMAGLRWNH